MLVVPLFFLDDHQIWNGHESQVRMIERLQENSQMEQSKNLEAQTTSLTLTLSNLKELIAQTGYRVTALGDDCLMLETPTTVRHLPVAANGTAISKFPSQLSKAVLIKILPFHSQTPYLVMRLDESESDFYVGWNQTFLSSLEEVCAAIDIAVGKVTNGNQRAEFAYENQLKPVRTAERTAG